MLTLLETKTGSVGNGLGPSLAQLSSSVAVIVVATRRDVSFAAVEWSLGAQPCGLSINHSSEDREIASYCLYHF